MQAEGMEAGWLNATGDPPGVCTQGATDTLHFSRPLRFTGGQSNPGSPELETRKEPQQNKDEASLRRGTAEKEIEILQTI